MQSFLHFAICPVEHAQVVWYCVAIKNVIFIETAIQAQGPLAVLLENKGRLKKSKICNFSKTLIQPV